MAALEVDYIGVTATRRQIGLWRDCFFIGLIWLLSLQSFYFSGVGSLPPVVATFLALGVAVLSGRLWGAWPKGLFIYFGTACTISVLLLANVVLRGANESEAKAAVGLMLFALSAVVWPLLLNERGRTVRILNGFLLLHIFFWVVQVFYFFLTREYLDYLAPFGIESRTFSNKGIVLPQVGLVPRFAGVFNEPGTYSVHVAAVVFLQLFLSRQLNVFCWVALTTCLFSLSAFGWVLSAAAIFLLLIYRRNFRALMGTAIALCLIFAALFASGALDSFVARFDSDYSGLDFRKEMLRWYFNAPIAEILSGLQTQKLPDWFISNDIGLWFWFVSGFGIVGWVAVCLLLGLATQSAGLGGLLVLGLILLTKVKGTYPFFWFLLILIATLSPKENNNYR